MENLILSLIVFVLAFIGRLSLYLFSKRKGKKKKMGVGTEMLYLIRKFDLNPKKVDTKTIACIISLLDAFIITLTLFICVTITDNITLELLIGLVFVVTLIIVSNEIFGRILIEKGYRK